MKKSSKKKQGLKGEFFKQWALRREKEYKTYKQIIKLIKHRPQVEFIFAKNG